MSEEFQKTLVVKPSYDLWMEDPLPFQKTVVDMTKLLSNNICLRLNVAFYVLLSQWLAEALKLAFKPLSKAFPNTLISGLVHRGSQLRIIHAETKNNSISLLNQDIILLFNLVQYNSTIRNQMD